MKLKFRILELKEDIYRPFFYPQYKTFWRWKNVGEHYFVKTVFNHNDELTSDKPYTYFKQEAEDAIEAFKRYLEDNRSYSQVHNYEIVHVQ